MTEPKQPLPYQEPEAEGGTHLELEPLPGPTEASESEDLPLDDETLEQAGLPFISPDPEEPSGPMVRNVFEATGATNERRMAMQVKDVMTPTVECVRPNESVAAAAQKMKDLDVGALPICGDDDRLVGMITDRDITVRATAGCCDPLSTRVRDAMTPGIVYVFDEQDITEAAELMKQNQVRRLPVLNRDKRLIGIVSLGDLALDVHDEEMVGTTLEAVSEPGTLRR